MIECMINHVCLDVLVDPMTLIERTLGRSARLESAIAARCEGDILHIWSGLVWVSTFYAVGNPENFCNTA